VDLKYLVVLEYLVVLVGPDLLGLGLQLDLLHLLVLDFLVDLLDLVGQDL
jgi:hypothetical protein